MANVFLFTGENVFALRQEKTRWMNEFTAKHGLENLLNIDGSDIPLNKLLDEVGAGPFIGTNRLIVVQGIPKYSKEEIQRIVNLIHPSAILLFCDPAPDRRLSAVKELLSAATVKVFAPLAPKPLRDWMLGHARQCGAGLDAAAADVLLRIVGQDQDMLAQEIAKMAVAGGTITADRVLAMAVPSGEQEVWELTNRIARGDLAGALQYARTLLRSGEDPFSLWNILLWMLRSLAAVTLCASEGERNPAKAASASGVSFGTVRTLLPMAQSVRLPALRELVAWATAADIDLKTGGYRVTGESTQELLALIDELVVRCCRLQERSASPDR